MRGVPTDNVRPGVALRQDIPKSLALSAGTRDRTDARAFGVGLRETVDSVLAGALAGRDRVPQNRRKNRSRGRDIAPSARFEERLGRRHQSSVNERTDYLPVGSIPTNEKHARGRTGHHGDAVAASGFPSAA